MIRNNMAALLCGCSLAAIGASPVLAQTQAPAQAQTPASAEGQATNLDEIVVTANRRATNVQETPLSITAVSGETLSNLGVQDTVALQQVTPGLTYNLNGPFAQPFLRGVGTDLTAVGSESSVATFVDDVYQSFPFAGIQVLSGVERVEVLKGPQGTLYGRNATGGAISVQTKNPSDAFGGDGEISYGNYGLIQGRGYITGRLADGVAANLAVSISHRDGYGTNLATGEDFNTEDYQYVRGKLRWDATDSLRLILSAYYFNRDDNSGMAYTYLNDQGSTPLAPLLGGRVTVRSQDTYAVYDPANRVQDFGANLRATLDLAGGVLTSITSFQHANAFIGTDFISTDIPIFDFKADDNEGRNVSQELYYSNSAGRLDYLFGANYTRSSARFDPITIFMGPTATLDQFLFIDTDAYAAYAEGKYAVTSRLSGTVGVRYSSEKKTQDRLDFITKTGTVLLSAGGASKTWDNLAFKALLQYDFDNGMLYAKYEGGFKSGSVISSVPGGFVEPETIDSYELGFKSEIFDRLVRLNGSVFFYDYSNLQVQYTDLATGAALIQTAKAAQIRGAEIQATYAPSSNFAIDLGLTYLDTEYTDFVSSGVFVPAAAGGNTNATADLSGNELVRAAPITGNLTVRWNAPLENGASIDANANLYYSGSYYFDITNRIEQEAFTTVSAQVRYNWPGDRVSLAVWGRNLADTEYLAIATPISFGDQAQLAPPRTFGITLSSRF